MHNMQIFRSYAWLLPFCFFIAGYVGAWILWRPDAQPLPNLVGRSAHDVLTVLSTHTLHPRILGHKYDPDVVPGTVLSQIPTAGTMIKPHQTVFLVLAQAPQLPIMPPLIRQSLKSIHAACAPCSITPTIYYLSHTWPADTCFAQSPPAGHEIPASCKPIVYVSSGKKRSVIWPSFLGKEVATVTDTLTKYGISPQILSEDDVAISTPHSSASIIDQRPLAGSLIDITRPETVTVQLRIFCNNDR
jgi:eukaryotic-like serine/threonine-protein kinase